MSARKNNTTTRPATTTAETTPTPATAAPVLRTDSEKALWAALSNFPGFTAAELAGAAGIGASTTRRILSTWATTGAARREPDPDNPRAAEHWSPAPPAPSTDNTAEPADQSREPHTPQPDNDDTGSDNDSAATDSDATEPATSPQEPPQQPAAAPTGSETPAPANDTPAGEPPAAEASQKTPDRLAPGALRGEVEDHLRDAPDKEFTPHEIGKALGRSSGAVHNALLKLTDLGTARQTCTRPKKFALALSQ
ncbi:hypothetical protein FHY52_09975 [Nocardia nova]|jgi:hypothetical protein|uniref:hypothetical protein n=1 Tax=Nocardia nova TaxID=37330 RepID=UPI0025B0E6A9|nr:hypothetical protein [Nocardia nova]MDN2497020.1 hypothetical protein [Nocardia nova]